MSMTTEQAVNMMMREMESARKDFEECGRISEHMAVYFKATVNAYANAAGTLEATKVANKFTEEVNAMLRSERVSA